MKAIASYILDNWSRAALGQKAIESGSDRCEEWKVGKVADRNPGTGVRSAMTIRIQAAAHDLHLIEREYRMKVQRPRQQPVFGIDIEKPDDLHVVAGLLLELTHHRVARMLAVLDLSPGSIHLPWSSAEDGPMRASRT